jgi:cardiolipin synthase A/B
LNFYVILSLTLSLTSTVMAATSAYHALMTKRDSRAALAWVAFCLFIPFAGPVIYLLFGINRISRTAQASYHGSTPEDFSEAICEPEGVDLRPLSRVGETITGMGLRSCDGIEILENGEACFPAMLGDIERAEHRVYCSTYIFQHDDTGQQFIAAFRAAMQRGVDVRVIVDGLGSVAYPPIAVGSLRKSGIRFESFDPITLLPPSIHINLRNHRKILVVDGKVGYAGGQNISNRHLVTRPNNHKVARDLHFRFTGKIVDELERAFLKDWTHAADIAQPEPFKPSNVNKQQSQIWTRLIPDGPNEDLDKLTKLLVGVMSAARKRIWIMTPYFLPSLDLVGALVAAELRGVDVKIMLPERTNIHLAHWAALHNLRYILERDLKVYLQPAPFIHTKAILIDDHYSLVGSANLDPRSLRLNFELVVEVFDEDFAHRIESYFNRCLAESTLLDESRLRSMPIWMRTRNAIAWLFSPYL